MNEKTKEHLQNGYEVKIGDYLSRGFDIFKSNVGGYVGYFVLYCIITFVLNFIPFVNLVSSVLIAPCLVFGFHLVSNHIATHGSEPPFGDYFNGFQYFGKIVIIAIIQGLLFLACILPFIFTIGFSLITQNLDDPTALVEAFAEGPIVLLICGVLITIYFAISWVFASMVAVFQDIESWQAMEISRKMVTQNWFMVLLFLIVVGIISMAGMFALGFGLLFTIPLGYCYIYAAYEDIFGDTIATESSNDIEAIGTIGDDIS